MRSRKTTTLFVLLIASGGCGRTQSGGEQPPAYVGVDACAGCHHEEHRLWLGSHHDLAMQRATTETVLGDFEDTTFTYSDVTSAFFTRDDRFYVSTDGPDGELQEYEIAFTFGVYPLQQYLIAFPDGRIQALGIAWDARPAREGGQRWFHLYPDDEIGHGDELHWTGRNQNWNYMCAECHVTDLHKNYDLEADRFETGWSELGVTCEACHGPGSAHVGWAHAKESAEGSSYDDVSKGLLVDLGDPSGGMWELASGSVIAQRTAPLRSRSQIEICARCHSRRELLSDTYVHGRPLLDTHRPRTLDEGLYHADGQILDEVYVYGSFLQSRMQAAGVRCSDCHDPHSQRVYADGNALCTRCHLASAYNGPSHHFHPEGSTGAVCVDCHMPAKPYMVVDPRRDHSLRIPRPDLASKLGTPNACNGCHTDRAPQWAAAAVARWYGSERGSSAHYGEVFQAGRDRNPSAVSSLAGLVTDTTQATIIRATALSLLGRYARPAVIPAIERSLRDGDLIRTAAVRALAALAPEDRIRLAYPLLNDRVRSVRLEVARILALVPRRLLSTPELAAIDSATSEYVEAQLVNADRPSAHMNIGNVRAARGELDEAEAAYRTALRLDRRFIPAYVNLADVYRVQGREVDSERLLRRALAFAPEDPTIHHALALSLVRQGRQVEAMEPLRQAAARSTENPRYGYVYAVALHSAGESRRAVSVLESALRDHPYDLAILTALTTISRDIGELDVALRYAEKLVELWPQDPAAQRLLSELQTMRP